MAVIDSGAEDNPLDATLALQLSLKMEPLENPINVRALNGKLPLTHCTGPLQLFLSGNDRQFISLKFFILRVLLWSYPWLKLHNLHIDWSHGRWSTGP